MLLEAFEINPLFADFSAIRNTFSRKFDEIQQNNIVFGDADFFGTYHRYANTGEFHSQVFFDHKHHSEVIKNIFPEAKIILTPRRQDTWLESAYNTYVRKYYTVDIKQFLNPDGGKHSWVFRTRSNKPCCDFRQLDWLKYVKNYARLFGRENVLVLPYEMMVEDLEEFLQHLYSFMEVEPYFPSSQEPTNPGYSSLSLKIALSLNKFIHTDHNKLGIIPVKPFFNFFLKRREQNPAYRILCGISSRLSLEIFLRKVIDKYIAVNKGILNKENRKEILIYYTELNKRYAKYINIDLEKYGYY